MFWKIRRLIPEKLKPHKISWKITIIYALVFSAVLIALNAGTLFGIRFFLIRQAKSQVYNISNDTLNIISSADNIGSLTKPEELKEASSNPEIGIRITDAAGNTLNSSGELAAGNLSVMTGIGQINVVETNDRHYVVGNSRLTTKDGKPSGYLQVCYDMHSEYRFVKLLFVFMAFADFLGILISVFAGHVISRRTLNPIDLMTKTAMEISSGDLKNRVEVSQANDELTRLAVTFNQMIERLQVSFEKQTQFVSDASHELRTPIAIIQGYADMIDRWGKNDPKVLEESITAIHKETKSMAALVEELLFLARGDSNRISLQKTDFQLGKLLEEITAESRLIAPQHHFSSTVRENITLHADRKLIKQALRAVVENSIKYTPENGSITINTFTCKNKAIIEVHDTGIGIPPEEQPKLFNRFYRVDKGRSKERGGSGLGLSIAKWIVEAHFGTVGVESSPGKGTTIKMQLSLSDSSCVSKF